MKLILLLVVLIGLTQSLPLPQEEQGARADRAVPPTTIVECENGANPEEVDKVVVIIDEGDFNPNEAEIDADVIVLCDAR